jgi:hypothetical protein
MLTVSAESSEWQAYDWLVPTDQDARDLVNFLEDMARFLWKEWPMEMELAHVDDNGSFVFRGTCPHCGALATFPTVSQPYVEKDDRGNPWRLTAPARCIGCRKCILAIIKLPYGVVREWVYEAHYPLGSPNDDVAEEIPNGIREDFQEAIRCLWVNAYNATAEMCRRALESACLKLGAPKHKVLQIMIDHLAEKGEITPYLQGAAHKIRLGGDRGAHPPEDIHDDKVVTDKDDDEGPVESLREEHAKFIVEYTREFFHHIFVGPARLDSYDFSKKGTANREIKRI